jgi:hypothetical protein
MKIKVVKKQLKKISALLEVMESEDTMTSIEKNLLKSYVQKLYGEILNLEVSDLSNESPLEIPVQSPKKKEVRDKQNSATSIKKVKKSESAIENVKVGEESTSFLNDPIDEVIGNGSLVQHSVVKEEVATLTNGISSHTLVDPKREIAEQVIDLPEIDEKVKLLFAESKSSELSDKLRNRPLQDINAGLGLNERILMVNNLFQGKHDVFRESISKLNTLGSFAEAKKYLLKHLINPMDWTNENRVESAASFIHLVRRRYI